MSSTYNGAARTMPLSIPEPRRPVETLAKFLASQRAAVVDVVPGATHASRRLLVGQLLGGRITHVVSVAAQDDLDPLDSEQRVLSGMPPVSEQLAATLPKAVGRVEVPPNHVGLVLTAVPGLAGSANGRARPSSPVLLGVVHEWLALLTQETRVEQVAEDVTGPVLDTFVTRYASSARLRPVLGQLQDAHARLADFPVSATATHGCLCTRHVRVEHQRVVGVDDWSNGLARGNPLRDLGAFAARVADARLGEVMLDRTPYAAMFREFVTAGLERAGVPGALWREVIVLGQFEIAVDALAHGDSDDIALLMAALRDMPARG